MFVDNDIREILNVLQSKQEVVIQKHFLVPPSEKQSMAMVDKALVSLNFPTAKKGYGYRSSYAQAGLSVAMHVLNQYIAEQNDGIQIKDIFPFDMSQFRTGLHLAKVHKSVIQELDRFQTVFNFLSAADPALLSQACLTWAMNFGNGDILRDYVNDPDWAKRWSKLIPKDAEYFSKKFLKDTETPDA